MPYGLNKATNYYNKLEAWRLWQETAEKARLMGLGDLTIELAPGNFWPWKRIDAQTAKLRQAMSAAQLPMQPTEAGQPLLKESVSNENR